MNSPEYFINIQLTEFILSVLDYWRNNLLSKSVWCTLISIDPVYNIAI